MLLQGSLSIERMCQLVPVSRRSFYRSLKEQRPAEEETEVRSVIQQIALEHRRRYGYRRITAELRRRGMQVNHKRVVRIMRKDNLLALQPKRFKVTTNSNHKFEVYLNLAARMKLTGIDQLWVADITYIRLKTEFVYLAVILDAFSRNRQRLHSALSYCPPEEFEGKAESQVENRGATIEVFVNNDNDEKISKGLLGTGTQMPSPSPDPPSPARTCKNTLTKAETVP